MREILPSRLWLGNAADIRDVESILQNGIQAVIDLAIEQLMPTLPRTLVFCRFPIMDGEQNSSTPLRTAIETLVLFLKRGIPTLVCCSAGMSRSPAVVAGALSVFQGGTPDDCLRQIVLGHPHDVSPQLWQDVRWICAEIAERRQP
jgi:protein-tyrosine phosphatase